MRYGALYRNRWFLAIVALPTLLAAIYYGLIASDEYISESRFVVKNQSEKPSSMSSIASLIQTTGLSQGQEQTSEVMDYIRSRNALADIQKTFDIKAAYAKRQADFRSRYPSLFEYDRFENLFRYYGHKVDVRLDTKTNLAVLEVRAFTPDDARDINALLLKLSEQLVNRLNIGADQNAIKESKQRVVVAEQRVRKARLALAQYRSQAGLLDPAKQSTGVLEISNKLVTQQAGLQAELDIMRRLTPENPGIAALREQIDAIGKQIDAQNAKAVGPDGSISSKIATYETLQLEQEFAAQALTAANIALEQNVTEAARQQFYLERVVEPNRPDVAELPHRWTQILTVFAVALCLYMIGWMLVVGILEHAPEN